MPSDLFDKLAREQGKVSSPSKGESGTELFDRLAREQDAKKKVDAAVAAQPAPPAPPVEQASAPAEKSEPPVDEALVQKIMTTSNVDEAEARRRERSAARLLAGGATVVRQSDEYTDFGSKTGAAIEGYARGLLPVDAVGMVEGGIGEFLRLGGWEDNPFTPVNISRREEANPYTAGSAELAGVLTTLGASALIKGGVKLAEKGAERVIAQAGERSLKSAGQRLLGAGEFGAGKLMSEPARLGQFADVPGKLAKTVATRGSARLAGTTLAKETERAGVELTALAERAEDLGGTLSTVEQKVLDTFNKASETQAGDVVTAFTRRVLEKPTKILPKALRVEARTAEEQALTRALRERAEVLIEAKMVDAYDKLGVPKALGDIAVKTVAGSAAGASGNLLYKGGRELMERWALTDDQRDALAESYVESVYNGTVEGGELGGALGLGLGILPHGFRLAANTARLANKGITERLVPFVAERFKKIEEAGKKTKGALKLADQFADVDVNKELKQLRQSLQYQVDYASQYADNLAAVQDEVLRDVNAARTASGLRNLTAAELGDSPLVANIKSASDELRTQLFNRRIRDGREVWVVDEKKLKDLYGKMELVPRADPITGELKYEVQLPEAWEKLNTAFNSVYDELSAMVSRAEVAPTGRPMTLAGRDALLENIGDIRYGTIPMGISEAVPLPDDFGRAASYAIVPPRGVEPSRLPMPAEQFMGLTRADLESAKLASAAGMFEDMVKVEEKGSRLVDVLLGTGIGKGADWLFNIGMLKSIGAGYLAPMIYRAATNPADAVDAYQRWQRFFSSTNKVSKDFARWTISAPGSTLFRSPGLLTEEGAEVLEDQVPALKGLKAQGDASKFSTAEVKRKESPTTERDFWDRDTAFYEKLSANPDLSPALGSNFTAMAETFPTLADQISLVTPVGINFLKEKRDELSMRGFAPLSFMTGVTNTAPVSRQKLYEYSIYSRYVHNSNRIFQDIADKQYVPRQAIEVLQRVYPAKYRMVKSDMLDALIEAKDKGVPVPREKLNIINKMLGIDANGLTPAQVRKLQADMNAPPARPAGGATGNREQLEREGTSNP